MNETEKLHISIKNKIIPTKYLYDDKGVNYLKTFVIQKSITSQGQKKYCAKIC